MPRSGIARGIEQATSTLERAFYAGAQAKQKKEQLSQQQLNEELKNLKFNYNSFMEMAKNAESPQTKRMYTNKALSAFNLHNQKAGVDIQLPQEFSQKQFDTNEKTIMNAMTSFGNISKKNLEGKMDPTQSLNEINAVYSQARQAFIDVPEEIEEEFGAVKQQVQRAKSAQALLPTLRDKFSKEDIDRLMPQLIAGGESAEIAREEIDRALEPAKPPTKAGIQAQFLSDALEGKIDFKNLTPGQQFLKRTMEKAGTTMRFDPETGRLTEFKIGETAEMAPGREISKPVQRQVQEGMVQAKEEIREFNRLLEKPGEVKELTGALNRLQIWYERLGDWVTNGLIDSEKAEKDSDFNTNLKLLKLRFRRAMTGVAFNPEEKKEYDELYPNLERDGIKITMAKVRAMRNIDQRRISTGAEILSANDFLLSFSNEIGNELQNAGKSPRELDTTPDRQPAQTPVQKSPVDLNQFWR